MFLSPSGGGVRRYLQQKSWWLERHSNWRHMVEAPLPAQPGIVTVPALALPFSQGYRMVLRREAAARVLERLRPDLIEAGDPYRLAWAALDTARRLDIPAVAFCHSHLECLAAQCAGKLAARLARRYMQRLYRRFDLVLAPSAWMQRHLEAIGVARSATQALGVDTAMFTPRRRDPGWRRRLGLPPDARVLLYAGRFAPEKHLATLAAAVAQLGPPYVLVVIGSGPMPPSGRRVRVLPFERDSYSLAQALASADAFVHAGDQETFGLAALEALACGMPVVARAEAGLGELIDERVGVLVEGAAPGDFAEAIAYLFERDRSGLATAARRLALRYDWNRVLPDLFAHYQRLLA
jgi:alpha-1,6-mannosyltransferase